MLRRNKEAEQLLSDVRSQCPKETQLELSGRGIPELAEEMSQYIVPEDQTVQKFNHPDPFPGTYTK